MLISPLSVTENCDTITVPICAQIIKPHKFSKATFPLIAKSEMLIICSKKDMKEAIFSQVHLDCVQSQFYSWSEDNKHQENLF